MAVMILTYLKWIEVQIIMPSALYRDDYLGDIVRGRMACPLGNRALYDDRPVRRLQWMTAVNALPNDTRDRNPSVGVAAVDQPYVISERPEI